MCYTLDIPIKGFLYIMFKSIISNLKPVLFLIALVGFFAAPATSYASGANADNLAGATVTDLDDTEGGSGKSVIDQVYNIIKFAYVFFYAIAVMIVAQAWLQFKQQKYDVMFASMGAALGLFLTPAIVDFLHGLGAKTAGAE